MNIRVKRIQAVLTLLVFLSGILTTAFHHHLHDHDHHGHHGHCHHQHHDHCESPNNLSISSSHGTDDYSSEHSSESCTICIGVQNIASTVVESGPQSIRQTVEFVSPTDSQEFKLFDGAELPSLRAPPLFPLV